MEVEPGKSMVIAMVPGWSGETEYPFSEETFPQELREHLKPDAIFLAKVNLGAEHLSELDPTNFELAPDPVPEEEFFS